MQFRRQGGNRGSGENRAAPTHANPPSAMFYSAAEAALKAAVADKTKVETLHSKLRASTGSNCEWRRSGRRHHTRSQFSQISQTSVAVGIAVRPVRAHRIGPRCAAEASTFAEGRYAGCRSAFGLE